MPLLTRMIPNMKSHPHRMSQLLSVPYFLHQEVYEIFRRDDEDDSRILYHQEGRNLLVLSPSGPVSPKGSWRFESKPFDPQIRLGDTLGFQITANAAINVTGKGVQPAVHYFQSKFPEKCEGLSFSQILDLSAQWWLGKKAGDSGFSLLQCSGGNYRWVRVKGRAKVAVMDIYGTLKVENVESFQKTLQAGLGRAKGFGFGMLRVHR